MLTNKLLGVIFDLDNTLVSSSLNFDHIKASIDCPNNVDLLSFVDSLPAEKQQIAKKLIIAHEMADALSAKKLEGTDKLLSLLSQYKIPCAIVTRNSQQAAALKVQNNAIDIPIILTREDHQPKPAPDALLYLAKHWNMAPENLLYVGDYLYDLQAALNANTMSCIVTHGQNLDYAHLADLVVHDLNELSNALEEPLHLSQTSLVSNHVC
ncbi:HAD family hydrolase [Colwelliaceae bacterium 6441]